jgi:hypothetical protein
MSSTKGWIVRRTWVQFLGGTILGQAWLISRPNSGLLWPFPLGTGELTPKNKKNLPLKLIHYCFMLFFFVILLLQWNMFSSFNYFPSPLLGLSIFDLVRIAYGSFERGVIRGLTEVMNLQGCCGILLAFHMTKKEDISLSKFCLLQSLKLFLAGCCLSLMCITRLFLVLLLRLAILSFFLLACFMFFWN